MEAIFKKKDELKTLVMQHFLENDTCEESRKSTATLDATYNDNNTSLKDSASSFGGLIESCAAERADLARQQFDLFMALRQLKILQDTV
eukprot:2876222-Pleurochrysis_carterae.AAC.1